MKFGQYSYFWSLDQRSFETLGVASVRTYVRPSVTLFLWNRSSDFSEILYEVRVQKVRKMFQGLFWSFSPFWPFWSKTVQNWPFWPKMTKNGGLQFANFCTKPSLWSRKKWRFHIFWKNSKMALFGQNLPKFAHLAWWMGLQHFF